MRVSSLVGAAAMLVGTDIPQWRDKHTPPAYDHTTAETRARDERKLAAAKAKRERKLTLRESRQK